MDSFVAIFLNLIKAIKYSNHFQPSFGFTYSLLVIYLSLIDTISNTLTATVSVADSPFGVAITPNGLCAYVTNSATPGTVSVIDTANYTVTATVTVGDGPLGVAITPNGAYAYVAKGASNPGTVSVIDTASYSVITAVTVGTFPFSIAITPEPGPQPPANISGAGGPKHTSSSGGFQLQAYYELSWSESAGAVSYNVYRAIGNADPVYIGNSTSLRYRDLGINWRQGYYYTVRAVDGVGNVGSPGTPVYLSYR